MITKQSVKISIVVTGQSLLSGGCVFKEAAPPTSRGIRRADRASIVPLLADRRQGMVLCPFGDVEQPPSLCHSSSRPLRSKDIVHDRHGTVKDGE